MQPDPRCSPVRLGYHSSDGYDISAPVSLSKRTGIVLPSSPFARLRRLNINDTAIVEELAEIQANHEFELRLGKATYLDILKGTIGKRLATGCALQALQQLTGINFICTS